MRNTYLNVWRFFLFFFIFVYYIKSIIYLAFTCKTFWCFYYSYIKTYFVNLLNSGQVLKPVVSGILFSVSVTFELSAVLVVRLVISFILLSTSTAFLFRAAFVARLVISSILFSISAVFVFSMVVVTNQ